MFRLVLLSVAMTVAMAAPSYIFDPELDSAWQMFKGNFEKVYDTNQEESFRYEICCFLLLSYQRKIKGTLNIA